MPEPTQRDNRSRPVPPTVDAVDADHQQSHQQQIVDEIVDEIQLKIRIQTKGRMKCDTHCPNQL